MSFLSQKTGVPNLRILNKAWAFLSSRALLSESSLKIENYLRQRIFKVDELVGEGKVSLVRRLENVHSRDEARYAVVDILDLLHCAETKTELGLLTRTLRLLCTEDMIDAKMFNFGASILRLYHFLDLPEEAFELWTDPVLSKMFCDNTCHLVLMDLLYSHKQYHKVLTVYDDLKYFNIECATLALGALYHINTQQSFEAALSMVQNSLQTKRGLLFTAMLALKQNKAAVALNVLTYCNKKGILDQNIEIMCLSRLGQVEEVIEALQRVCVLSEDITKPLQMRLYRDTMEVVLQSAAKAGEDKLVELNELHRELSGLGVLSQQFTEKLLDKTIPGNSNYTKERAKHPSLIKNKDR